MRYMVVSDAGCSPDSNRPHRSPPRPARRTQTLRTCFMSVMPESTFSMPSWRGVRMPSASAWPRIWSTRPRDWIRRLIASEPSISSCRPTRPCSPGCSAHPADRNGEPEAALLVTEGLAPAPERARGGPGVGGEVPGSGACPRSTRRAGWRARPRRHGKARGTSGTGRLARRWASTPSSASAKLNRSMPMSSRRTTDSRRAVGVQGREHQVAGQRGLDADRDGLVVASAHHDHVGVGAQEGAHHGGEVDRPCG